MDLIHVIAQKPQVTHTDSMTDYVQVRCPESGKHEVVELEPSASGRPCVAWCSKALGCPRCPQTCLKQLQTVGYVMLTEVPRLQLKELPRLSVDQILARFEDYPHSVLPVLDEGRLMGSLAYRDAATWQDHRADRAGLSYEQWSDTPKDDFELSGSWKLEAETVAPTDCWKVAADKMLAIHRNELFVVDENGLFLGLVYARQLLRVAVGDSQT